MRTELYWIEGPWTGRLAIMPRPRGGDWLEDEISSWTRLGINTIISALTKEESEELDLIREKELCEKGGIEFVAFPIADRGVPLSAKGTLELVGRLEQELARGRKVAIHCRQGIGRASLLAACVLAAGGVDVASAFERIAATRGCAVPDTSEQRAWVARFAREMRSGLPARDAVAEAERVHVASDPVSKLTAKLRELGVDPESL
ncbi:MAG TPA: protein-tyrosine phosphatase family protein [Gemmataceae bacterium]|jgi:protein-tyrosine phosphatase